MESAVRDRDLSNAYNHNDICLEQRVVEECQGQQLHLTCPQGAVIQLQSIRLADSDCYFSNCCPKSDDCSAAPSAQHQQTVQHHCEGQTSCSVMTEKRKIPCGYLSVNVYNDYERITYRCIGLSFTLFSDFRPQRSLHVHFINERCNAVRI